MMNIEHELETLSRLSFESRIVDILRKLNEKIDKLEQKLSSNDSNNHDEDDVEEDNERVEMPQMFERSPMVFGGNNLLNAILVSQMGGHSGMPNLCTENID